MHTIPTTPPTARHDLARAAKYVEEQRLELARIARAYEVAP